MEALLNRDSNSTLATRASLLANLADPARATRWEEFDRIYRSVVLRIAVGEGLQHQDAQDVTQDVFCELVERLTKFKLGARPGSFRRFLRQLVVWRSHTGLRRIRRSSCMHLDDHHSAEIPAAPSEPESPDYQGAVLGAMQAMRADLTQRDLQILELYYCAAWRARKVAETLNLTERTVYSVARRHKARLAREIRRRIELEV